MSALLAAQDWFENSLQDILRSQGFNPATKSQAAVLNYMSSGEFKPSTIARKMRLSRQALSHIVKSMVEADLVITLPDPSDKRAIRLEFSPKAEKIRVASRIALSSLEELLAGRIGTHTVDDLWRALDVDWGNRIETKSELDEILIRKPRRE
jgi:DNA-binding MarR family transcriptional regulator